MEVTYWPEAKGFRPCQPTGCCAVLVPRAVLMGVLGPVTLLSYPKPFHFELRTC